VRIKSFVPWLMAVLAVIIVVFLLWEAPIVRSAVGTGMQLAAGSLVPSLFLFAVVAQLLVRTGLLRPFERLTAPVFRLLHLPKASASAFLLGAAGGYPLGAETVAALHSAGQLSRSEAEEALGFTNNCGIAYVVSVVAPKLGLTTAETLAFYAIHLLSALAAAILLHAFGGTSDTTAPATADRGKPEPFSAALAASVRSAALSMLLLTGFVCVFAVFTALLRQIPISFPAYVGGILELSGGIAALTAGEHTTAAFLIGFGGFCVVCQAAAAASPHKLRLHRYLIGKLLQGVFSAIAVKILF